MRCKVSAVDAPSYYTTAELQQLYPDIPIRQWWSWSQRGKIRTVKSAGRVMFIPASEVDRILKQKLPLASIYREFGLMSKGPPRK
jgi:hypothetical protein